MKQTMSRDQIELFARALQAAKQNNALPAEDVAALHARFRAEDAQGAPWTVGLRLLKWHRLHQGRWVSGNPPDKLLVDVSLVAELNTLLRPQSPPKAAENHAQRGGSVGDFGAQIPARLEHPTAAVCSACGSPAPAGHKFCPPCAARLTHSPASSSRSWLLPAVLFSLILVAGLALTTYLAFFRPAQQISDPNTMAASNGNTQAAARASNTPAPELAGIIPGWKLYECRVNRISRTSDWSYYDLHNGVIPYSIQYPGQWKLRDEMLFLPKGKKIVELLPGVVRLKKGQRCFDRPPGQEGLLAPELIEEANIELGDGLRGVRRVEKDHYEDGPARESGALYLITYCLEQNDKAFVMRFYQRDSLTTTERALFDQVVSTFRFK